MTMNLNYLAPVKIGETVVPAIKSISLTSAAKEVVEANGGEVDPSFVGATSAEPVIEFATLAMATMLGEYSTAQLTAISASKHLEMYLNAADNYGTRKTGSNHSKFTMTRGLLVPTDVTANGDDLVSIGNKCIVGWDGTNEATAKSFSVALPSSDMPEPFVAGGVRFNGVAVEGVFSTTISHGWSVESKRDQGDKYPTFVWAAKRRPRVTLKTSADMIAEYGPLGSKITGNGLAVFYFRKCKLGGDLYPKSTACHISCTVYGNALPDGPSGSGDNPLDAGVTILPYKPAGGNPAITWANGVAIP